MEANAVLLGLVLREAGVTVGAAAAERLCSSMGRLGITMTKSRPDGAQTPPAIAAEPSRRITVDMRSDGSVTVSVPV